jgi:hypothetical protein
LLISSLNLSWNRAGTGLESPATREIGISGRCRYRSKIRIQGRLLDPVHFSASI